MSDVQNPDIVSAAFDGERVDLAELRAALAGEEGRAALASFLLLRAAMRADDTAPATPITAVSAGVVSRIPRRWRVAAGVAAATVVLVFGFWAGGAWTTRHPAAPQSATQNGAPVGASPAAGTATPGEAPRPTRVLRFTPGVDWHNRS